MGVFTIGPLAQEEEELEYSWGIVSKVSSDKIVVKEQDYETDEDIDVTYTIDAETKIENVKSLADIAAGDDIEIDYMIAGGKKIARSILVEKPDAAAEEGFMEEQPYEEGVEY